MSRTGNSWRRVARGSMTIAKTAGTIDLFLLAAGFLFLLRYAFLGERFADLLFFWGNLLGPALAVVFIVCIAIVLAALSVCAVAKTFERLDEWPDPNDGSARNPGESGKRIGNRWDAAARRSVSLVRIAAISIFPLLVAAIIVLPFSEPFGSVFAAAMILCVVSIPVAMAVNVIAKEVARRRPQGGR